MNCFDRLHITEDRDDRMAALNMAIDEALLETVVIPTIRFYRWNHPAISFGYFGRLTDLEPVDGKDIVRRWTGGGIVFHGADLTYGLVIPKAFSELGNSPASVYENTHCAIQCALARLNIRVALQHPNPTRPPTASTPDKDRCFANPVRSDVMLNGDKIAGAAQRRTRRGLLQQGSIQGVALPAAFGAVFASELSREIEPLHLPPAVLARAKQIAESKYAAQAWLGKH